MNFEAKRQELVEHLNERDELSEQTSNAMATVPRHEFVPASKEDRAYEDTPLSIGEGQTISAPHMVAIMTELLELSGGERILEIGTGCGYHAAITAEVAGRQNVYSVEYHKKLANQAAQTLELTGYGNISIRAGDGREGWEEYSPYDRIYLTCAPEEFPDSLVDQLRDGGIILGPLGDRRQVLTKGRKRGTSLNRERHGNVRFVPLK